MPFISYFMLAGCNGPQIPNFTNYPIDVYLGRYEQGPNFNEIVFGAASPYTPSSQLLALGRSFSGGAVPGISDKNNNVWTQQQAYAANGSGMLAFTATANANVTPDQFNYSPGSYNAGSLLTILEVAQAAGNFTVSYASSNTGTISVTTAGGYTLTLTCGTSGASGGIAELIVFEWGGGVAGKTYRIAYLTANIPTTVFPAGWTYQTLNWFPFITWGQNPADGFYDFSDIPVPPPPPCQILASSTSLSFSKSPCGADPATQTVQITNQANQPVSWTATTNSPWITLNPVAGVTPGTLTVGVNTTGLAPGTYNGSITISSADCGNPVVPVIAVVLVVGQMVIAACIPDPNADEVNTPVLNGVYTSFIQQGQVVNPPGFPAGTYNFAQFNQAGPNVVAFGGELWTVACGRERIVMIVPDQYNDDGVGIDSRYRPWMVQMPPNVLRHGGYRMQLQGNGTIRITPFSERDTDQNEYEYREVELSVDTQVSFEKGLRATEKYLTLEISNKAVCDAFFIIQEIVNHANAWYAGSRNPKK